MSFDPLAHIQLSGVFEAYHRYLTSFAGVFALSASPKLARLDGSPIPCWQCNHVCWEVRYVVA